MDWESVKTFFTTAGFDLLRGLLTLAVFIVRIVMTYLVRCDEKLIANTRRAEYVLIILLFIGCVCNILTILRSGGASGRGRLVRIFKRYACPEQWILFGILVWGIISCLSMDAAYEGAWFTGNRYAMEDMAVSVLVLFPMTMLFEKREIRENPAGDRGRLLVVGSSEKGAMQHWALTWQVKRDHFERKTRIHPEASKIAEILDRWVTSASFEEREAFISTLFDAMDQFGPAMSDVINAGLRGYNTILSGLLRGSPETRTAVGKYFQSLLNVGVESAVENVKGALESVGNAVRSRTKEIGEGREALEQALCEKDTERAKREDRDERLNNQIQRTKILESGGERDRENPPDLGADLTGEEERWEKQEQAQAREQNQLRSLPGPVRKSRAQWGKKGRKKRASSLSWKMTKNRSSRP